MALTKTQANTVKDMFLTAYINESDPELRKNLFFDFEDTFNRGIPDWRGDCATRIQEMTNDVETLDQFARLLTRVYEDKREYEIRPLEENDLEQVRELINKAFSRHLTDFDDEELKSYLKDECSFVACEGENICGVILAYIIPSLDYKHIYIDTFTVAEDMRNHGIGSKLLKATGEAGHKKKIFCFRLQTKKDSDAYRKYIHWGFEANDFVQMRVYM